MCILETRKPVPSINTMTVIRVPPNDNVQAETHSAICSPLTVWEHRGLDLPSDINTSSFFHDPLRAANLPSGFILSLHPLEGSRHVALTLWKMASERAQAFQTVLPHVHPYLSSSRQGVGSSLRKEGRARLTPSTLALHFGLVTLFIA